MNADAVYSTALLIALLAGGIAIACAAVDRVTQGRAKIWARISMPSVVVAWLAVLVSFSVHLRFGHTPGTPQALPPFEFLREHVSFVVAAFLSGAALVIRPRRTRARGRGGGTTRGGH